MERVTFWLRREEKKAIDALAEREGKTTSDLFREGVAWVLKRYKTRPKSSAERR
jgi:hypothetical protein